MFILLWMLGSPKYNEKTEEHIHVKKFIRPKDGFIFDFMIRPPNDESEIIENSLLLVVPKSESISHSSMGVDATEVKLELVEKLLREASIEGFNLSYPSESTPDIFPLKRMSPLYCSLCDQKHTNENAYIIQNKKSYSFHCYRADQEKPSGSRKPSIKLAPSETALN